MYALMIYSLKVGACLAVFYLFFKLLLSRETFHRLNRIVVLAAMVLSFILPFCVITIYRELPAAPEMPAAEQLFEAPAEPQPEPFPWDKAAALVFLTGAGATLLWTFGSVFGVIRMIRRGRRERLADGTVLVRIGRSVTPFSWYRYIVLSEKDLAENGDAIVLHEKAHLRLRHSVDLLLTDLAGCLQWFNPAMWLLRRELRAIHEYEADEAVLDSGVDAKHYQLLLIRKAAGGRWYSVANSFNHSKLKKRITMMLKEKSNPWARLKYLYVLPLAAIAVTAFARPEISGKMDEISAVKVNDFVQIVGTKVPEKKVEVLKDTVKKDAPKEEAFEVSRLETVPTHSKVTITDGMKRSGMDLFSVRNAGSQPHPLILVDGKEITGEQMQRDINPDMIESISVLKDEASTAIYGDKAKHGVILITLKGKDVQNVLSLSASDPEDGVKVVGVVKDHLDKPLAGASVFISGTVSGTMSDAYGRFVLLAPKNAMLRISYTGMTTVEKAVAPEVNVTLNPAD